MPVFEYVVSYHPNDEERKAGKRAEILVPPKAVCAKDEDAAGLIAAREIPEEYVEKIDGVEVAVRPFAA